MDQEQINELAREHGAPYVFDRMFSAVEKVHERLDRAGQKVKGSYPVPAPEVGQATEIERKKIVDLESLLAMKLADFRRIDRVHIRDMTDVGLINQAWPAKFGSPLAERLQELLDDPDG